MQIKNRGIKRIKHEYNKQLKYFYCCYDAYDINVTASNVCDNIIRAKLSVLILSEISFLFFFLFMLTSFTFFSKQKVLSLSSFQESLILFF